MLVGITGSANSGRRTVVKYLVSLGFKEIEYNEEQLEGVVSRWQENFVVLIPLEPNEVRKRPWFIHLNIERIDGSIASSNEESHLRIRNIRNAHINIVNHGSIGELHRQIDQIDLKNQELRPSWDTYFMKMANLAAQRSNCMKRRVGCVLVSENRVVATGYNGTPRGVLNCCDGGCIRCNSGSRGGTMLSTCLCLHAEENALLEAGRVRSENATLYCNTCPCLTCSIKIVQMGVKEVIYSQDYSMDTESAQVLRGAGLLLRKFGQGT